MFRRRGSPGADGAEGASLVARAAWAFVTPALVLLIYVLGKPVRADAAAGRLRTRCASLTRAPPQIYWSLAAKYSFLPVPALVQAHLGGARRAPRACALQRSRARTRRPQRLCCPARG